MKKIIVAALGLLLLAEVVSAQEKAPVSPEVVIPKPVKVVPAQGSFNAPGKVPRVICHLCQKSEAFLAKKGCRKFSFRFTPKILAAPITISMEPAKSIYSWIVKIMAA